MPPQHPSGKRPRPGADTFDIGCPDNGHRDARDFLAQHDVVCARLEDGVLVVQVCAALAGGNKTGAHLDPRIARLYGAGKCTGSAYPASADQRFAERCQLIQQLLRCQCPGVSAGTIIYTDKTVNTAIQGFFGPPAAGDIVVHRDAFCCGPVHYPARIAQCRDQQWHLFLQGYIQPAVDPLQVFFRASLDNQVNANRLAGQTADIAQPRAEFVAVHITQAQRLDDAYTTCLGDCGDQFGVGAGVHGATDQRDIDTEATAELSGQRTVLFQDRSASGLPHWQLCRRRCRESPP